MRCLAAGVGLGMILAAAGVLAAAEPPAPTASDIVLKTLPGITVDTEKREVRLEGTVCLREGLLELLICRQGTREHESIVATPARPSHVTFALALLGLEPGQPGFWTEAGAFSPPAGEILDVTVRFTTPKAEGGEGPSQTSEVPAWRLLRLVGSGAELSQPLQWVYVGQPGEAALRAADREGTVVCLSNFVEAVIDVPFESTSVNANLLYEANPDTVPPAGTPAEVILRPTGKRIKPQKVQIEIVLRQGEPPTLDGQATDLEALADAVHAMPISVRAAAVKAEPDVPFGQVMAVKRILEDALIQVRLMILEPTPTEPVAEKPPLRVTVTPDDRVHVGQESLTVDEFRQKAEELLRDVPRMVLATEPETSWKTVAEVLAIAREHHVVVTISQAETPKEK